MAATPLVTEMLPGVMTPVPFANTPVSEALPPAVMEAGLAEKLEIEAAGGKALPLPCDIRDEQSVEKSVAETVARFGGIDILVNNASAISRTGKKTFHENS